ncbi:sensor histidine kinase KdpD [Curtobacterium sp. 9128]|uniref:sensor histidine kinase n=1 Tax=Curtobacterium sp. 9128 TaxID=1793722 RepID=UPI0011A261CC|nr:HAMP domain-containing sensor histidine kinase [Curtobacterium sp. 9128]
MTVPTVTRQRSLTGRIVLTTVAVAVVAALAVAVVGFQLVRQESIAQTALVLRTSAQAVAVTPVSERPAFADRIERRSRGRVDVGFGGTGTVTGIGTRLPSGLEARLASDTRVAVRQVSGWRTLLVQAVPARGGGSVIAVEDVSVLHADAVLGRFAAALGIGLLVAVGLGVVVARVVTRPLRSVAATAARLAGGERGVLPVCSASVDGTVREVDDVRNALAVLDAELARSESAQREFLLSISHEFRTPLAAVRGYADALADGLVPPADIPRVAGVVRVETERLDAFVGDLLALARTEADDFPLHPEPVDVPLLVSASVLAWQGRAATVGASVVVGPGTRDARVVTDPQRLRQVVDGLVENALRVVDPGGHVVVHVTASSTAITISVEDDGPGIDPGDLHRAFVRGALRDRYRQERPVGTGLGLSIAARLVERLGGTIQAVPRTRGTAFRVELPTEPRHGSPDTTRTRA